MNSKKIIQLYVYCNLLMGYLLASQYGPGLLFHKPYPTNPYQTHYFMSFAYGNTDQAYNKAGQIVPYLEEYGQEDFLKKFIDDKLPSTDTTKIGNITFGGNFNFQQLNLCCIKNIHHDLFIGVATSIRNLSIENISTQIQLTETLTAQEQLELLIFESKIPKQMNRSGIFATVIELGYNKIYTHFDTIDFLHCFIKAGISAPQWMTGQHVAALQYPIAGNIAFSYPITAIVSCGILDHVNFGLYGLIIPIQPSQQVLPVNTTQSNNQILLTQATRVMVNPKPLFSAVGFMELYNFIPKCMATIGYGYAYGMPWSLQSLDEKNFPSPTINRTSILNAWNISSMFFQLDYSFPSKEQSQTMNLSLFYTLPISGNLYPKINVVGGNYSLMFNYKF